MDISCIHDNVHLIDELSLKLKNHIRDNNYKACNDIMLDTIKKLDELKAIISSASQEIAESISKFITNLLSHIHDDGNELYLCISTINCKISNYIQQISKQDDCVLQTLTSVDLKQRVNNIISYLNISKEFYEKQGLAIYNLTASIIVVSGSVISIIASLNGSQEVSCLLKSAISLFVACVILGVTSLVCNILFVNKKKSEFENEMNRYIKEGGDICPNQIEKLLNYKRNYFFDYLCVFIFVVSLILLSMDFVFLHNGEHNEQKSFNIIQDSTSICLNTK